MNRPRIIIAGTQSGAGKTSVSLTLMSALTRAGHRVQAFKVGPDYIDPSYHRAATGFPSHNLDAWLLARETVQWLFQMKSERADISVIEGVMGLYDGLGTKDETSSTAQMAKHLNAPVVLVLDAHGMARSAAAVVKGYQNFDANIKLRGVILNKLGSARHYAILKEAIEHHTDLPVLGGIFRDQKVQIPERHLGLTPAEENKGLKNCLDSLAENAKGDPRLNRSGIDLARILKIAKSAPPLPSVSAPDGLPGEADADETNRVRIGMAQDRAFSFYYQANLDLLRDLGAELVPFSPLSDPDVPENCGALYFGGGFPEFYARELEMNGPMTHAIRKRIQGGLPVYAECGGLMYLSESIETLEGKNYSMACVVPGNVVMTKSLKNFGYKRGKMVADTVLGGKGNSVRGHEFHYSERSFDNDAKGSGFSYELMDSKAERQQLEGYARNSLLASYLHLHFYSNPKWARSFVRAAKNFTKE